MNEQLQGLIQLQEKDSRILHIQERQKVLPGLIDSLQEKLRQAQEGLSSATGSLQKNEAARRGLETTLKEIEEKIRKFKGKTQEIKTNKEYQSLLKEIQIAEEERSGIEEKVLVLMEEADKIRDVAASRKQTTHQEEEIFLKEKAKVEQDFEIMRSELDGLKKEQELIAGRIEHSLLASYRKVFNTRKGIGVVPLQGEHCSGCHINIPPQLYTEVKKNDKIQACPNCQRLLYWKG